MEKNIVANIAAKRTKSRIYLFFKRVFDIFSSSVALVVLSPVFLIIAILIKKKITDLYFIIINVWDNTEKIWSSINFEA